MMPYQFLKKIVFTTFFTSFFSIIFISISLVTNHWVESKPWRIPNPLKSSGYVCLGLLYGRKELNVAFGWRPHEISITDIIEQNPELFSRNLWYVTLFSTCMSLICAFLAAFCAIINCATGPQMKFFSFCTIFYINTLTLMMCLTSIFSWCIQFYTKLIINILPKEDLDNFWTSKGATSLGFSFWLIVIAGILQGINVFLITLSLNLNSKKKQKPLQPFEEKSVSAIMLY